MNQDSKLVALFVDHSQAEAAIRSLQKLGFGMKELSIVGPDYQNEEQVLGYVSSGALASIGEVQIRQVAAYLSTLPPP